MQIGDYVGQVHPSEKMILKKGIVVSTNKDCYEVQWLSFNKEFWMEFEGDAFAELNKRYLLTRMSYNRSHNESDIIILSKAGGNGVG